jgi:UDP-glucose/iron transport system permease protein
MNHSVQTISVANLAYAFLPAFVVIGILYKWSINPGKAFYALNRMLIQLLLIGYVLVYLFQSDKAWIIMMILAVMVFSSSWIALGTISDQRLKLFKITLVSITLGGGLTLLLITGVVLKLNPWYLPQYMIPLAGMIFANSMNSVSLAAERMRAELDRGETYLQARKIAFHAALIPLINTLFAVGLVSLPGMMTGQILAGISPLIASRYQIMVMCMVFGSAGISAACFLMLYKPMCVLKSSEN